ncbi:MAG: cobalamin B12-binding domain-containing protein [Isosphaeraceae bacterium]
MSRKFEWPAEAERERLGALAAEVVEVTLAELDRLHPEWEARFGARGRDHCREDLHHHIEYVRTCLETGSVEPFEDYARWLASVLEGRGIAPRHLAESFDLLAAAFGARLDAKDYSAIEAVLGAGIAALERPGPYEPAYDRHLPEAMPAAKSMAEALVAGDRALSRRILFEPLEQGMPLVDVGVGLVQPAMYEIGRLWQSSRVSIAQEHLATAIAESLLAQAFATAEFARPVARKAVFACVPGNHHVLGLRVVSDAFELNGWQVQFLGANAPALSLIQQVDRFAPELLGLSIALPSQVPGARELLGRLRAELGGRCPAVLVGGLALNQLDGLWRDLGADLWGADARAALRETH